MQRGADIGYGVDTVRGDAAHPVSRGLACSRGIEESRDPDGQWLSRPLVRDGGELRTTTWDVALTRATQGLQQAHGNDPDSVAVLGSGQQTNEAAYVLGKLARGGFGTRNYDANTTLCMASAVTAYYQAFGSDAPPCTYDDIDEADRHVVWGANPAVAHPVLYRWLLDSAAQDGRRLIVVDPVESETATDADQHVAIESGTDLVLAQAVLARFVETDRLDRAFIEAATDGFEELAASLPDVETAAATAGVPVETVAELAAAFDDRTLLYWSMGVNQSTHGTDAAGMLVNLCLATGNMGPGSGPFSLTGQANSMGTRICSSKGSWPGQRAFEDPDHRRLVADEWGIPVDRLPDNTGPGPVGMLENGPDAVWAVATNPVAGMPEADSARVQLEDAFVVAQDAFHTETTELADVVLPAATWGESDGTAINMERTVSRVRPATDLPGGVRTDLDIITSLGDGLADDLFEATDPESVFAEFAALTADTDADCSGIGYERLEAELAVRWPAPDPTTSAGYRYHDDGEWSFPTPSGRARFAGGTGRDLPEPPDEEYPLTLTTAREEDGYNTGVRSRDPPGDPEAVLARVHPETAAERLGAPDAGRPDGEPTTATIESRRGSATVRVDADDAVPQDVVWLPIHHPATNRLTVPATDPRSDEPNFKQCAVRLAD